jgi:peptidoglycan/LPS O-acetylase OafA/YrhL
MGFTSNRDHSIQTNSAFAARENNLDFVRLGLAILVVFSHSFPLGGGDERLEPMMKLSHGQTTLGTIAVDLFFVISGFLITNSFLRSNSVWSYLKKRVARIYPGFVVCMLFCALVVVPLSGAHFAQKTLAMRGLSFGGRTLFLQLPSTVGAFRGNSNTSIDGSVWSISYEFYCYLGVALLGLCGSLRRRRTVALLFLSSLIFLAGFLFLAISPAHVHSYFWQRTALRFPLVPIYLAGMVFFLYREQIPHRNWLAAVAASLLGISCFLPGSWFLIFPIAGTYLVFWFGFHPSIRLRKASRFGDFSYGAYLYAFPIQQLIVQKCGHLLNPELLFLIATPAALMAGVLSWYGVERWFLSPGRKHRIDRPILPPGSTAEAEEAATPALAGR